VGSLFDGYGRVATGPLGRAIDEAIGPGMAPRPGYEDAVAVLSQMSKEDVTARSARLARAFMDQGVTFDLDGEERPFPLDVMPRIFTQREWDTISEGLAQRMRALEAFLADIYHSARILDDEVIPHYVVTSSPGFLRAAYGIDPPNGVRIHVAGIDIVRDEDGRFRVLEDNLRCPSGVSYVLANRTAMARILPEVFWGHPIGMVSDYPARLVRALRMASPGGVADPTVVVLTPGVHNPAFYEHALLARLMGVHLVEGRDLVCHGTDVFLRTTEGEIPVHVIYRRIDDDYMDPLHFRPDSLIGCPGLLNATRAGRVTVANAVGNGVADDKLVYAFVPDMIRYYLDEDPVLENVETYPLVDEERRASALKQRHELVFKRVDSSGGKDIVIGPLATREELEEVSAAVERSPRSWIAQRTVALSTSPMWVDGAMRPRHVDLRPFAVNDGEQVWVMPGGLTRVARDEGGLIVNSSRGGGSKDTWVIRDGESTPGDASPRWRHDGVAGDGRSENLPSSWPTNGASVTDDTGPPMDEGPPSGTVRAQQQQQQQQ
jgi:uncharacterized circularly permuted ATP-grasp superfamily protein